LDSIPGYQSSPEPQRLRQALQTAGCAIIGQTAELAPADRRLYAIRDVTATVESIALITASILSKKLAAGLHGLVMDIKLGNGAFAASDTMAVELAQSLVTVANGAGLPTRAWITDMNQVLGDSCGNAVEMREAVEFLQGKRRETRLLEVTRGLSAELLLLGGLALDQVQALRQVDTALDSGAALARFARMVAELGGPADFVERINDYLPGAPVQRPVIAPRSGWISGMATRDIGLLIIELGGGRRRAGDAVDPRVGFTQFAHIGQRVEKGDLLAVAHAADADAAENAAQALIPLIQIAELAPALTPALISLIPA
jgi:thymidine phosphorylase